MTATPTTTTTSMKTRARASAAPPVTAGADRPKELVHLVWARALDADLDRDPSGTLELVQLAGNHRSVLEHAIGYGKAHRQECATEAAVARALQALEEAVALVRLP